MSCDDFMLCAINALPRYASLQNTFFTQAADVLTRREALRAFVALCKSDLRRFS
jgi:hypothetical protein